MGNVTIPNTLEGKMQVFAAIGKNMNNLQKGSIIYFYNILIKYNNINVLISQQSHCENLYQIFRICGLQLCNIVERQFRQFFQHGKVVSGGFAWRRFAVDLHSNGCLSQNARGVSATLYYSISFNRNIYNIIASCVPIRIALCNGMQTIILSMFSKRNVDKTNLQLNFRKFVACQIVTCQVAVDFEPLYK